LRWDAGNYEVADEQGANHASNSNNPNEHGIFGNIVYAKDALGVQILASP